jgi:hypothetical protein
MFSHFCPEFTAVHQRHEAKLAPADLDLRWPRN